MTDAATIDGSDVLFLDRIKLGNPKVPQAWAVDNILGFLFVAQLKNETWSDRRGDLLITRIRISDKKIMGTMTLRGFGHGIALGVQPEPNSKQKPKGSWLWLECGPIILVNGGSGISGRGTRIVRLMFVPGREVICNSKGEFSANQGTKRHILPATTVLSISGKRPAAVSVDAESNLLIYKDGSSYTIFRMTDVVKNENPIPITQTNIGGSGTFQGFVIREQWIYILRGASGEKPTITRYDTTNGNSVTEPTSATDNRKGYFEPEGIGFIDGILSWGLSTGIPGARRLTIYKKANNVT